MCTYNVIKNKSVSVSLPLSFSQFGKKWTVTSSTAEMKMEKLQSRKVSCDKGRQEPGAYVRLSHNQGWGKVGGHQQQSCS